MAGRLSCVVLVLLSGCGAPLFSTPFVTRDMVPHDVETILAPAVEERPVAIPPRPKLDDFETEKPTQPITLAHAVLTGLERSPQIRVVGYDQRIAARQVILEDSNFDPTLSIGANWTSSTNQSATQIGSLGDDDGTTSVRQLGLPPLQPDTVSLAKRLRGGGFATLGLGITRDETDSNGSLVLINPAWRTNINISIEQPLGRGFGRQVNELGIQIARSNHEQSVHQFRQRVAELVRDINLAYWELALSEMSVKQNIASVKEAHDTRAKVVERFRVSSASLPELAQAVQFAEGRQTELSRTMSRRDEGEGRLRGLLGIPPEDGRRLTTADAPFDDRYLANWERGVQLAFENRPELADGAERIRSARLGLAAAKDQLKPDVTAFATAATAGLADNFGDATDIAFANDFGSWALGLRYSRPLGRRADRLNHELAALNVGQARAGLRQTEETVLTELRTSFQEIERSYKAIQHERVRVQAAEVLKQSRDEMYELGLLTIDDLFAGQLAVDDAKLALKLRLVEYNIAITQWRFATGTILAQGDDPAGDITEATTLSEPVLDLLLNPPPTPVLPDFEPPPTPEIMVPSEDNWERYLPPLENDFGAAAVETNGSDMPAPGETAPIPRSPSPTAVDIATPEDGWRARE